MFRSANPIGPIKKMAHFVSFFSLILNNFASFRVVSQNRLHKGYFNCYFSFRVWKRNLAGHPKIHYTIVSRNNRTKPARVTPTRVCVGGILTPPPSLARHINLPLITIYPTLLRIGMVSPFLAPPPPPTHRPQFPHPQGPCTHRSAVHRVSPPGPIRPPSRRTPSRHTPAPRRTSPGPPAAAPRPSRSVRAGGKLVGWQAGWVGGVGGQGRAQGPPQALPPSTTPRTPQKR